VDDAAAISQEEAVVATKEAAAADAIDEKNDLRRYSLFLPGMQAGSETADAASTDVLVMFEGFEGIWPAGCWSRRDANGTGELWDDTSTRRFSGFWSGHPDDGDPIANRTDTWMRCGPLNLTGASTARLTFVYFLQAETTFDFFSWEVSCSGTTNWSRGESRSGSPGVWRSVNYSLTPCVGSSNVYIRFNFRSDSSVISNGVWVDNIRVDKF
jgi:hypothetical protein